MVGSDFELSRVILVLCFWLLLLPFPPVRRGKQAGINPEGAAHRDVRRFWSSRMLLPKIPGLLANPAASSPGAP